MSSVIEVVPETEQPACRRFTLADALILIAGLALVLSMGAHLLSLFADSVLKVVQTVAANRAYVWEHWPVFWRALRVPVATTISYACQFAGSLIAGMTPIFFVLRLRRPRPPWRELLLRPGTASGLAIVFGLFWVLGLAQIAFPDRLDSIAGPFIAIGGTVAAVWLILLLCRRWNAEPGWVDRLGRLLGAIAIGTALLGLVMYRI